jgi:hypothetical protein
VEGRILQGVSASMKDKRRQGIGSMPMSISFSPSQWMWLRKKKQGDMPFNISEFVDDAVRRQKMHLEAAHSSEKSMLDALDRDQLLTYAIRCLNKVQKLSATEHEFNAWGDIIASVVNAPVHEGEEE